MLPKVFRHSQDVATIRNLQLSNDYNNQSGDTLESGRGESTERKLANFKNHTKLSLTRLKASSALE